MNGCFPLSEKCLSSEFFLSVFSRIRTECSDLLHKYRIQSECGKIRTRKTPNADTFYVVFAGNSVGQMHL